MPILAGAFKDAGAGQKQARIKLPQTERRKKMARRVLYTHPMIESGLKELQELGYEIFCPKEKLPRQEIIAIAKD